MHFRVTVSEVPILLAWATGVMGLSGTVVSCNPEVFLPLDRGRFSLHLWHACIIHIPFPSTPS
jgi:hypothetical protein